MNKWIDKFCEVMHVNLVETLWLDGEPHFRFSDGEIYTEKAIKAFLKNLKGVDIEK